MLLPTMGVQIHLIQMLKLQSMLPASPGKMLGSINLELMAMLVLSMFFIYKRSTQTSTIMLIQTTLMVMSISFRLHSRLRLGNNSVRQQIFSQQSLGTGMVLTTMLYLLSKRKMLRNKLMTTLLMPQMMLMMTLVI